MGRPHGERQGWHGSVYFRPDRLDKLLGIHPDPREALYALVDAIEEPPVGGAVKSPPRNPPLQPTPKAAALPPKAVVPPLASGNRAAGLLPKQSAVVVSVEEGFCGGCVRKGNVRSCQRCPKNGGEG